MTVRTFVYKGVSLAVGFSLLTEIVRGLIYPEHTALLLRDTGMVPSALASFAALILPLLLLISLTLLLLKRGTLTLVTVSLILYTLPAGVALQQGLHIDCGCYLPASLESNVYTELRSRFIFQSILIVSLLILPWISTKEVQVNTFDETSCHKYKN